MRGESEARTRPEGGGGEGHESRLFTHFDVFVEYIPYFLVLHRRNGGWGERGGGVVLLRIAVNIPPCHDAFPLHR